MRGFRYENFIFNINDELFEFKVAWCACYNGLCACALEALEWDDSKFKFLTDNCQHFATWCKTGENRSRQLEAVVKAIKDLENFADQCQ